MNTKCEFHSNEDCNITMEGALPIIHFDSRSLYGNFTKIKEYLHQFKMFNFTVASKI